MKIWQDLKTDSTGWRFQRIENHRSPTGKSRDRKAYFGGFGSEACDEVGEMVEDGGFNEAKALIWETWHVTYIYRIYIHN